MSQVNGQGNGRCGRHGSGTRLAARSDMRTSLRISIPATYVLLAVTMAATGCSSTTLKPDAGAGQAGHDGGAGATGTAGGGAGAAGGGTAGSTGTAGVTGAAGGAAGVGGTGGAGGEVGACDTDEDCVFHTVCCGGTCTAKTDPSPAPMVCSTSCVINLGPATCGCVNHKCSSMSACIVPGSGLCPYCPNGYLTGATGCQTCQCAGGDAGLDSSTDGGGDAHALGDSCDDGRGCADGLVCKAIGDPCPTYPKCNRCYRPCGDGGACPATERCFPPVGQGGNVCI